MIAKAIKGRGFRGALEYNLKKGRIIDSNMAGQDPRSLAAEFGSVRRLRPSVGKAVFHVSLSAAPGESLTDEQWQEIALRYLQGMGFDNNQFVVIRHTDTEHEHVHVIANRIRVDGSVVSDSQDWKRQEAIMRQIERDFGLQQVAPSAEAERKAPTKGEIERALRTGEPSTKQRLQQLCDAAAMGCTSFSEYVDRLEAVGVEVVPVVQLGGAKLSGLSYRLDGVIMKGSDLGKAYTAAGIQKRGISYEQGRDFEAARRCIERETRRAFGDPDRDLETSSTPERGGVGRDAGAAGPGDGGFDGRDAADAGRDRSQSAGADAVLQPDHGAGLGAGEGGGRSHEPRSGADGAAGGAADDAFDRAGRSDGRRGSYPYDRIVALASTADSAPGHTSSGGRSGETPKDRTTEAVRRQVGSFGVDQVEVGIRDSKTGRMMNRTWSLDELERAIPWLKRMNARGADVYIRPAGEHALVLVDDLTREAVEQMKTDGFMPAAIIETSPNNFQAWVRLSDQPLSADVRRLAARALAKRYVGDLNSADSRHYGRLAGFTNQKPKYRDSRGYQPYVLAHECTGTVAKDAPLLIEAIEERLAEMELRRERDQRMAAIEKVSEGAAGAVAEYRRQAKVLLRRYGKDVDFSRLDWMIATDMARRGWSQDAIERAIIEASPHIETRKAGHIEDYARRTAMKACAAAIEREHDQEERRENRAARQRHFPFSP